MSGYSIYKYLNRNLFWAFVTFLPIYTIGVTLLLIVINASLHMPLPIPPSCWAQPVFLNTSTSYYLILSPGHYFVVPAMKKYKPTDATTNPSLMLAAASLPQYKHLIEKAVEFGKKNGKLVLFFFMKINVWMTVNYCSTKWNMRFRQDEGCN